MRWIKEKLMLYVGRSIESAYYDIWLSLFTLPGNCHLTTYMGLPVKECGTSKSVNHARITELGLQLLNQGLHLSPIDTDRERFSECVLLEHSSHSRLVAKIPLTDSLIPGRYAFQFTDGRRIALSEATDEDLGLLATDITMNTGAMILRNKVDEAMVPNLNQVSAAGQLSVPWA